MRASVAEVSSRAILDCELFIAAAIWYLLLTTLWGLVQARIERRLARGSGDTELNMPGLRSRLFGAFGGGR